MLKALNYTVHFWHLIGPSLVLTLRVMSDPIPSNTQKSHKYMEKYWWVHFWTQRVCLNPLDSRGSCPWTHTYMTKHHSFLHMITQSGSSWTLKKIFQFMESVQGWRIGIGIGMIIGILSINCRGIMAEDWCSLWGGLWLHSNAPSLMKRTGSVLGLGILLIQKIEISLRF